MGVFSVPIAVGNLAGTRYVELEAMVDTGASHTVVPSNTLAPLELEIDELARFEIADGGVVEYPMGYAKIRLAGLEVEATVIFGPEGALPLLGASTLELGHLSVDPVGKRLVPISAYSREET